MMVSSRWNRDLFVDAVRYLLCLILLISHCLADGYHRIPARVKVLPIAFIPQGQLPPTASDEALFLRHLKWTQTRYAELLDEDTFEFASSPPTLKAIHGRRRLEDYRDTREGGAPLIVGEILDKLGLDRFENPYVFAILIMNTVDRFPLGGGRPINGGTNAGGGMFYISSGELIKNEHFQCTLQHELGHAFGLSHVDAYGYNQLKNASMMSYDPSHHNRGFVPSMTPGIFIPEDRRVLALNDRVFAKTKFDIKQDVPPDYDLFPFVMPLPPMEIPGHSNFYPTATTNAGEAVGSKAERCLYGYIRPSIKYGEGLGVTYDPGNMWHTTHHLMVEQATLEIMFPFPVEIDGLGIHTQHSALDHHATHVKLFAVDSDPVSLLDRPLKGIDEEFGFPLTKSQKWRVELTPGPSKTIVVRGIRFLKNSDEIYPRMAPYRPLSSIP